MMKYVDPQIKPYHFITDIETTDSAVVTRRYVEDATLIENIDNTETRIHTRFESIRDIISYD
ncbi:MAG: hypothetical protein IJH37_00470 [Clostridia bacterium]|nr:hypothetical protein [Clostridia bacterium]